MDLTATAAANDARRQAAAKAAIGADGSGRLGRFAALVAGSPCSTNVSAHKVLVFHEVGEILDARRYQVQRAGGDVSAAAEAFEGDQETSLEPRQAFEDLWEHGRRLLYGAVNAGGMGTEGRYGPFCLVVPAPDNPEPDALAVFPGNTAERYASGPVADEAAACRDATSWGQRSGLAVEER